MIMMMSMTCLRLLTTRTSLQSRLLRGMANNVESDDRILLAAYPRLPLPEDRVQQLVDEGHDFAHAHGLVMRMKQSKDKSEICQSAPFALLPTPFPKSLFDQAVKVQNSIASLYHEIAYDYDFLAKCHAEVVKTDSFTKNMMDILKKVLDEGLAQKTTLAIQRSDYMCHKDVFTSEYTLKQIEVNNIASSMGAHAERVTKLHRRTLQTLGFDDAFLDRAIPKNEPIQLISEALYKAWKHINDDNAVVLVIIEETNQNQLDQRHVEYALEARGVPPDQIVRQTLTQCYSNLTLNDDRQLIYLGSRVSVVYFRAGYSPDHYPSEHEWSARLVIERSDAIKSPWIGLQVANTKKTQQVLAADGSVERYIGSPREAAAVRATFAGLWALDGNDQPTRNIIKGAIDHNDTFVLKPQLEGGAGNYYDDEMSKMLKEMPAEERGAYILMEKIKPMRAENYLIRSNEPHALEDVVSELGIYGYAFGEKGSPELKTGGHLLRTKGEKTNEGGVAVGAAVIDSPFLFEFI